MELVCIQKFGDCEVGDIREVPDDAEFSPMYFAVKPAEGEPEPAQIAQADERALGEDPDREDTPVVSPPADTEDYSAGSDALAQNES